MIKWIIVMVIVDWFAILWEAHDWFKWSVLTRIMKTRKQFLNQNCHVLGTSYKNNPSLSFMEQSQSNCRIENTSMQYLALLIVVVSSVSLVYFPLFCFKDSSFLR